jgi:hypothetical protein
MAEPTYAESAWNGLPNYVCLACGYSTLHLTKLTAHLHASHRLPPVPVAASAPGAVAVAPEAPSSPLQVHAEDATLTAEEELP